MKALLPLPTPTFTTFDGHRRIATGALRDNALALKHALEGGGPGPVFMFDDATGRTVEVDIRGTDEECWARLETRFPVTEVAVVAEAAEEAEQPRGRGRPKLGVVPREVTLLPRHWEWLDTQQGGSSVALRKLVEEARRQSGEKDKGRKALERAYQFMVVMAGDLAGFEEVSRALFANDVRKMQGLMADWPRDVSEHVMRLACGDAMQAGDEGKAGGAQA